MPAQKRYLSNYQDDNNNNEDDDENSPQHQHRRRKQSRRVVGEQTRANMEEQQVDEKEEEEDEQTQAQDNDDEDDDDQEEINQSSEDDSEGSGTDPEAFDELIAVSRSEIRTNVQCPICLGIIKRTRVVMGCQHRFCRECIDKSMRLGNNECPACRIHCASRRSLRDDPGFDTLIEAIYPDVEKYEEEELVFLEEERALNEQIQASIAQISQRQSEALIKRRKVGKDIAASSAQRTPRNYHNAYSRRRRNSQGAEPERSDPNESENDDHDRNKDSPPKDERGTQTKFRKRRRRKGALATPTSPSAASPDGGHIETAAELPRETVGNSPGPSLKPETLTWGRGGVRSHSRHGSASGSRNARNTRISKLVDYLESVRTNDGELNIHLELIPLDKQTTPSLKKPHLCLVRKTADGGNDVGLGPLIGDIEKEKMRSHSNLTLMNDIVHSTLKANLMGTELMGRIATLEREKREYAKAATEAQVAAQNWKEQFDSAQRNIEGLRASKAQLEQEKGTLSSELTVAKASSNQLVKDKEVLIKDKGVLTGLLSDATGEIEKLKALVQEKETRAIELVQSLDQPRADLRISSSEVVALKASLDSSLADHEATKNELAEWSSDYEKLAGDYESLANNFNTQVQLAYFNGRRDALVEVTNGNFDLKSELTTVLGLIEGLSQPVDTPSPTQPIPETPGVEESLSGEVTAEISEVVAQVTEGEMAVTQSEEIDVPVTTTSLDGINTSGSAEVASSGVVTVPSVASKSGASSSVDIP